MGDHVAVVTGANRGLGRAIALALARSGMRVAATARDPASLSGTVSSMTGKRPLQGRTPYASAKMGVLGLVRSLATELGQYDVRVNSVCPGAIAGPRIDAVIAEQAANRGMNESQARATFTTASPMDRLVSAGEVAATCAFLASDAATGITGEDLNVSAVRSCIDLFISTPELHPR